VPHGTSLKSTFTYGKHQCRQQNFFKLQIKISKAAHTLRNKCAKILYNLHLNERAKHEHIHVRPRKSKIQDSRSGVLLAKIAHFLLSGSSFTIPIMHNIF